MTTTATLITSQHYLDDAIVAEKQLAGDYAVRVSPAFEFLGSTYRVVLDGPPFARRRARQRRGAGARRGDRSDA